MFAKELEKSGVFIVRKMREQPRALGWQSGLSC
jgi:hypothetical protein